MLNDFLAGAAVFGFFIGCILFLRSWRRTRDSLFLAFATAFALLAIGQTVLVVSNLPTEERGYLYLFRLAAFTIIIIAIVRKNRGK